MRSNQAKKIVLGILLLLLVYIWWGNVQQFVAPDEIDSTAITTDIGNANAGMGKTRLSYLSPKINPFRRFNVFAENVKPITRKQAPPPVAPKLDKSFVLDGLLNRGNTSQAVIRMSDGSTMILAVGDSLGAWKLQSITTGYVVFIQDKTTDTLWLEQQRNAN